MIYEVLWARMLGLVFGATTLAVSTVLAAFMGGLALGSAVSGRIGAKVKHPVRAYGLLEIAIALYVLACLLFSLVDNLYAVISAQQLHPGFYAFSLWRFPAFVLDAAGAHHSDGGYASAAVSGPAAFECQDVDVDQHSVHSATLPARFAVA